MSAPLDAARTGTLSDLMRDLAATRGDRETLVYPAFAHGGQERRLSARALDRRVDDLARGLLTLDLAPGDHVALWARNVPDWVPLEFALARIGVVLVTVNTALKADEVAFVLRQSKAVAVLHTTSTGTNQASSILDDLLADDPPPHLRVRVWLRGEPDEAPPTGRVPGAPGPAPLPDLEALVARGQALPPDLLASREAATRRDDVVNIQYTSGTTGFPKGVMLSHGNVLSSAIDLGDELDIGPDDRVALMVPLFHCFGCVVAVLGTYVYGGSLHALQAFDPGDALQLVHEERCTIIHGVPTMYGAMLAHPDRPGRDTSTLRAGLAAGAPCPVPLMEAIDRDLECSGIVVAYGLTEASPGVAGSVPGDPLTVRAQTIGRPLPHVEIQVTDPATGEAVPHGSEGELWVRGPNVMQGYHDDPRATAAVITPEGWLRTGDLGLVGPDGNLRIVGRIKDIIIRGGENIAPAEVEGLLREHPDVLDAAVVGVPDERLGEEVAAALVLREGCRLDPEALEELLRDRVAAFKVPRQWHALESFPLTGSGKVQKFRLREMLAP